MQPELQGRLNASLDSLLGALQLEQLGEDRFVVVAEPGRFSYLFGGQMVAQALSAAVATVDAKPVHSLHAYFVEAGVANEPVEITVQRIRDGRAISIRQVALVQHAKTLLTATCSFHRGEPGRRFGEAPLDSPAPEELPLLQDWIERAPGAIRPHLDAWFEHPPPIEMRMAEALNFMGGAPADGHRAHWIRLPRPVGDDPGLHAVLLAYSTDYFMLDMIPRANPTGQSLSEFSGFSLDHAIWFHRPVRFDQWHLYSMHVQAISDERGLVRGLIHDAEGNLVASVMQEGLIRNGRSR